ncbi:hypothetical protein [Acidovorax sp. LjRoot117]|uniref:hypothetical protein n=1 Tax=Acidovorax sp. LjRoot117 TaxID=3342255 RepID=UPI003ECFAA0E
MRSGADTELRAARFGADLRRLWREMSQPLALFIRCNGSATNLFKKQDGTCEQEVTGLFAQART